MTTTWKTTNTFADLCALMALWLEGKIPSRPAYEQHCRPEKETTALIPTLAAANRCGFLTDNSQPGWSSRRQKQRPAVDGFVSDDRLLSRLVSGARREGLTVVVDGRPGPVVVTEVHQRPFTEFGVTVPSLDLDYLWGGDIGTGARLDLLLRTHQVAIIDPAYAPGDRLWKLLDQISGRTR